MKFFLDANMPSSSAGVFKKFNHKVQHAREIGMANSPDNKIIKYAVKNKQVLVTKDLDFGNILDYPIEIHHGVLILRLPFYYTAKQINNALSDFLKIAEEKEIKNAITILEVNRYRVRKQ